MNTPNLFSSFPANHLRTGPTASRLKSSRGEPWINHPKFQAVAVETSGYEDGSGNGINADVSGIDYVPILTYPVFKYGSWYYQTPPSSEVLSYCDSNLTTYVYGLNDTSYFNKVCGAVTLRALDTNLNPYYIQSSKAKLYGPISGYLKQYKNVTGLGVVDPYNTNSFGYYTLEVVANSGNGLQSSTYYNLGVDEYIEMIPAHISDVNKWSVAVFKYDNTVT